MAVAMPSIIINFKELAENISTSSTGDVILLMKDETAPTDVVHTFRSTSELMDAAGKYTTANIAYIEDAMDAGAAVVHTVRVTGTVQNALAIVEQNAMTGWITICDGESADFEALTAWIKAQETAHQGRSQYYGIVFNASAPNSQHIVNFATATVTFADSRGEKAGSTYLPTLAGQIASCGMNRGCTYLACDSLIAVSATIANTALATGKLFLVADGATIRIGCGINSCTDDVSDAFKYIDTTVVIDSIYFGINNIWKNSYCGRVRNTTANQMLFIAAINDFFAGLENNGVLDADFDNSAAVDVAAQRAAWVTENGSAAEWTDDQVIARPYRRSVFLTGNIHVVGTIDTVVFNVGLE